MQRSALNSLAALLLVLALAAAFRLPALGTARPMHGDEANQAVRAGILLETGRYEYDPHEHHGPTLYYGVLPVLWLCGVHRLAEAEEWQFRLLPVLFSLAGIALLWRWRSASGSLAVVFAGLFIAISPVQTYYARYFIQESLFVFFSFCILVLVREYFQKPDARRAFLIGVLIGLLHATKETSILVIASLFAAAGIVYGLKRTRIEKPVIREGMRHACWLLLGTVVVVVMLFSSFFTHWRGPMDALLTYSSYFTRAEGTGSTALHDKPWYYYFSLLLHTHRMAGPHWSEAPLLLLGIAGLSMGLLGRGLPIGADTQSQRLLAVYALLLSVLYAAIPYKTPWNLLPFYFPLLLLAGLGAAGLLEGAWRFRRPLLRLAGTGTLLLLVGLTLFWMARLNWASNHTYAADIRNPYVYAHTSSALMRLVERVDQIRAVSPGGVLGPVYIIKPDGDYWPLPWYLRKFDRVGYWQRMPLLEGIPFIIADPRLQTELEKQLDSGYHVEMHALRPDVKLLAYIRNDLWEAFMATRR